MQARRVPLLAVPAVLAGLAGGAASNTAADDFAPSPIPDRVSAQLVGARAHLVAHFSIPVRHAGLTSSIALDLPAGGVVTAATASSGRTSHRLALDEAATSQQAFETVLAAAAGRERTWAVHLTADPSQTQLLVEIAAARAGSVGLEIEVDVGTCFYRDARYVELPADWQTVAPRALAAHETSDAFFTACGGDKDTGRLGFVTSELAALPPGEPRLAAFGERLAVGDDNFARVELDLGDTLSEVPSDLATAILIDGSRSVTAQEAEVQRAIVAAYLRATPGSRVQVIDYARTARPLLPAWTGATAAASAVDLAMRQLTARNGSNLDAGLAEAAAWLKRIDGTRRIIAFTDERLAKRLETMPAAALHGLVPAGTVVHVVALEAGAGELVRDDADKLAQFAALTEGILVRGHVDGHGTVDATMLARPLTLDNLAIRAPGWTVFHPPGERCELTNQSQLGEGVACTWWGRGEAAAGPIAISGLLWNKRVTRLVRPDPTQARELARELMTIEGLEARLKELVDRAAMAVGHGWSLYGTWGGSAGYGDLATLDRFAFGSLDSCCGDTGFFTTTGHIVDTVGTAPRLELRSQFVDAAKRCKVAPGSAVVSIETTRQEIVDVGVQLKPFDRAVHDCLVDAVWDVAVVIPNAPEQSSTSFAL